MTEAVLIFTFSPIQSFISEARRTGDLFVGSRILVKLARAAAEFIRGASDTTRLIYPASMESDIPNRMVAIVPWAQVSEIATDARKELLKRWTEISEQARFNLQAGDMPKMDELWKRIWESQRDNVWEIYWVAEKMVDNDYRTAYKHAKRRLDAIKKARHFAPSQEVGLKDSLSGRRAALTTESYNNHSKSDYWAAVAANVTVAKLRPNGRERLDTRGAVKRFCNDAKQPFASTSTIASQAYLCEAVAKAPELVKEYRDQLDKFDIEYKPRATSKNQHYTFEKEFPYDGDLLYEDILTPKQFEQEYNSPIKDSILLNEARNKLKQLYKKIGRPPTYYAILLLDGDSMGQKISQILEEENAIAAHSNFSRNLSQFAGKVLQVVRTESTMGELVYSGGDDVLALLPLSTVYETAQQLAQDFASLTDGTASAGLAIVHHTYPLYSAIRAVHEAEQSAKKAYGDDKNALCISVLKRSGVPYKVHSQWSTLRTKDKDMFQYIIQLFRSESLSSKFAYEVSQSTYALPYADRQFEAELKRLVNRHRDSTKLSDAQVIALVTDLKKWADAMPNSHEATPEFADWLILAQFLSTGGTD